MRKDKGLNGDLDRLPMLTWIMFLKFLDNMEQVREAEAKLAGKRYRQSIEGPYRWRDWAAKPEGVTGPELIAFINQDEAVRPDGTRGDGLFAYLPAGKRQWRRTGRDYARIPGHHQPHGEWLSSPGRD
jgi:type I restriction enzyme M protein